MESVRFVKIFRLIHIKKDKNSEIIQYYLFFRKVFRVYFFEGFWCAVYESGIQIAHWL